MKSFVRNLTNGASSTQYDVEFTEKMAVLEVTKRQTERMIDVLKNYAKDSLGGVAAGMNRYEKCGEVVATYGSKCTDTKASGAIRAAKPFFDNIGKHYRALSQHIMDNMVTAMDQWVKVELKAMCTEVQKLKKLKDDMDSATNKARGKENNEELMNKKAAAEAAHTAQFEATKTVLGKLPEEQDKQQRLFAVFIEKQAKMYADIKAEYEAMASALNI